MSSIAPADHSVDSAGSPLRRSLVWRVVQIALQITFSVWLRFRARGTEKIPPEGGALILANHQSFLDPLLIGVPLRRSVSFLARENLFRIPFIGWVLRNTYVMPLNMEGASLAAIREALRRMQKGFLVGLFPEGTRSRDGKLGPIKPGFTTLVRRVELPIIPAGIAGTHRALGVGSRFLKPTRVCIVFGDPIPPAEIAPFRERGREDELVAFVRSRIVECMAEAEAWLNEEGARGERRGAREEGSIDAAPTNLESSPATP